MTSPFPQIQNQVIQDPGTGNAIAAGLAQVLAAQQAQREQEWRQQQLQHDWANQQAQLAVSQGNLAVNQQQLSAQTTETLNKRNAQAQVGTAQQAALGIGQPSAAPSPTAVPGQPQAEPGSFSQVLTGGAQQLAPSQGNPNIFGGVAAENMPAAVQGVQEIQKLSPQPPEPTGDVKNFEYLMRVAKTDPQRALLFKQLFLDQKPTTQITNIAGQGESEFSKELGKAQAGFLQEGEKQARGAIQSFPSQSEAYGLVDKSFTGFGAKTLLNLARAAGAVDFKPTGNKVADTQTLLRLTREQTLAYLRTRDLGSGNAISNQDREFMEQMSGADITADPQAIKRIIRINLGAGVMRIKESINDLHDQALVYPQNAVQLNRKAQQLQGRLVPIESKYATMLAAEGTAVSDIRKRLMKLPGIQLP